MAISGIFYMLSYFWIRAVFYSRHETRTKCFQLMKSQSRDNVFPDYDWRYKLFGDFRSW